MTLLTQIMDFGVGSESRMSTEEFEAICKAVAMDMAVNELDRLGTHDGIISMLRLRQKHILENCGRSQ